MSVDASRGAGATAPRTVRLRTVVLLACAAVVLARLVYAWQPLHADEGGYLLAARSWRTGGEFLYGDYHVDRPPLLLALFRLAAVSEWDGAIRILSIPFVLAAVVAAARAGYLAAGDAGARWSTVVAAALFSSPAVAADLSDADLFAAVFVMVSVALTLEAWGRPLAATQLWLALAAGAAGAAASLVKQSFLDGLVFVAVLVTADAVRRRQLSRCCRLVAVGAGVGALLPYLAVAAWTWSAGVDASGMWTELVAFRRDAFAVIWEGSTQAPVVRGLRLVLLTVVSAMAPIGWTWVSACRGRASPLSPEECAVTAGLTYGVIAIVAGGSYWVHYLLQLVAMLALAAGIVAASGCPAAATMRRWSKVAAGAAVVAAGVTTTVYATVPSVWYQQRIGEWLGRSSVPGDTAFVAYGAPSILEAADLGSPYPYLWSLPMRTLDPRQDRLRATLAGPEAPTWLVQVNAFDSWGIDERGRLRRLVEARYDVAATVCGQDVWLRSGLSRDQAPLPRC